MLQYLSCHNMGSGYAMLLLSLLVAVCAAVWLLPLGSGHLVGPLAVLVGGMLLSAFLVAGYGLLLACGPLWLPALLLGWIGACCTSCCVRVEAAIWWLKVARAVCRLPATCWCLPSLLWHQLRLLFQQRIPILSLLRLPLLTTTITTISYFLPPIPLPTIAQFTTLSMPPFFTNPSFLSIATLYFAIPLATPYLSSILASLHHLFLKRYWLLAMRFAVQRLRCRMLFRQSVHWFMNPYLPLYVNETRKELIRRMHKQHLYLKSSTLKHWLFTPRPDTLPIRRQTSPPTSLHLRVLLTAVVLLSSTAIAAAGGVGMSGIAAAMSSAEAGQFASVNLQFLAVADPGMSFGRVTRTIDRMYQGPFGACQQQVFASIGDYQPDGATGHNPTTSKYWKDPENQWIIGDHPGFSTFQREQLQQLLLDNRSSFAYSMSDLTGYTGAKFIIELKHDRPIVQRPRHHSPLELAIQDEKCVEMHKAGIIRHADIDTQYASNATMPAKKDVDGNWTDTRFCIDFRDINEATVADMYAMHLPEDLFQAVGVSCFFSKIDMRSAFHQIALDPASQAATSFWWRNQLFCFTRMPFGLRNASAACQRVMDLEIGKAGLRDNCVCFVDDLLVHSKTAEEHLQHLSAVFDMLASCGLKAHPAKSLFCCESVEYLGHDISAKGLTPHEAKVAAVKGLRVPTNVSELKSVLGFLGYYRCYVRSFSEIAAPLNALTGKGVPWQWTQQHQLAYQQLKDAMCKEGAALKRFDPARDVIVYADWSQQGIGAVLAQHDDDGNEYMVACASRSLNKHERAYCSWEGEALAGVWAVKTFRKYLFGKHFTIVTDHQPLKWLLQSTNLSGKHMRWALSMQEFDCTIEHRPGLAHQNVDVPSRFPLASSFDPTGACMDPELPASGSSATAVEARPAATVACACSASCHNPAAALATAFDAGTVEHACERAGLEAALAEGGDGFMGTYAPCVDDLLTGHAGVLADPLNTVPELRDPAAAAETCELRANASRLVSAAAQQLQRIRSEAPHLLEAGGEADQHGVLPDVTKLCTRRVGTALYEAGMGQGVVLYEPCGGIASGLEAVLANGIRVQRFLYSDIDAAACAVAQSRVWALHYKYPHLLPVGAFTAAFDTMPADVRQVDVGALVEAGALDGAQWLVVAGWSCEDLSAAGKGRGLQGKRSRNFFDIVRIVGGLQQLQPERPPAFVLENTDMQSGNSHETVREHAFPKICGVLGQPVVLDAARCGAFAYRLRNFWSNIADPFAVQLVCDSITRAPGRYVQSVLDPGRQAQVAVRPQRLPWYQCNAVAGQQLEALPTLVSFVKSRAFCVQSDGTVPRGMLFVTATGEWVEPNPDERERIMGYQTGCTAVPGVSGVQRHELMGRAMDRHAVTTLFSVYMSLSGHAAHFAGLAWGGEPAIPLVAPSMLPPLARLQLQSMYPFGVTHLQQLGWQVGQPLKSRGGLPWPLSTPLDTARRGLGYTGCTAVQGGDGQSASTSAAASTQSVHLPLYVEGVEGTLPSIPEWVAVSFDFDAGQLGGKRQRSGTAWEYDCKAVKQSDLNTAGSVMRQVAAVQLGVGLRHATAAEEGMGVGSMTASKGSRVVGLVSDHERLVVHSALATEAEVVEHLGGVVVDVLEDRNVLQYLR